MGAERFAAFIAVEERWEDAERRRQQLLGDERLVRGGVEGRSFVRAPHPHQHPGTLAVEVE